MTGLVTTRPLALPETTAPRTRRRSAEVQGFAGYPIAPIGDARHGRDGSDAVVDFPAIGWQIVTPGERGKLESGAVLDVYVGLLFLYEASGAPASGEITFSRYEFLQMLGWLSASTGATGTALVKPSGRHYGQLRRAFRYLARTLFIQRGPGLQIDLNGEAFTGEQGFPILQYYKVANDPTGPRLAGSGPRPSLVRLSAPFLAMLQAGVGSAMDVDTYLALPAGTPRALYRLCGWLRDQPQAPIPLQELFQRLGSKQRTALPARARQILSTAHDALQAHGVLRAAPEYVKGPDGWGVRYDFTVPLEQRTVGELLIAAALQYGVTAAVARELAVTQPVNLARALVGVAGGYLWPTKTLPGLVVHVARRGLAVDGLRPTACPVTRPDQAYLAWLQDHRTQRPAQALSATAAEAVRVLGEVLGQDPALLPGCAVLVQDVEWGTRSFPAWLAGQGQGGGRGLLAPTGLSSR